MAVRQYIGARYVTKIYENSLDPSSAEWEAGVTYEPLTLVTYLNSSYLSKKNVPGSVGDPASNPAYWVVTGAYNGQIATLQNQIDAINATLSNLNNAPFDYSESDDVIVIGDSWAVGLHATHGLSYWMELYLPHDNFYHGETNGSGFAVVGNSFKDILDGITVSDNNTIKHIMVLGGLNDRNQASLETDLATFLTAAHTNYPNATIDVIAANRLQFGSVTRYDYVNKYKKVCDEYTYARFIDATHIINAFEWYDTAHLNDTGYEELAKSIINVIKTGSYTTQTGYTAVNMSALGGDITGSLNVVQGNDGGVYLRHGTINAYGTLTISGSIKNLDFTLASDINSTDSYLGVCWIYLTDTDGSRTVPANISTPNSTTLRYTFVDTGETYSHILIADTAMYLGNLY